MGPVFTRLLFIATLLIQTPANPAVDKGVITGRLLTIDGTPAVAVRVMAMAVTEPAPAAASGNAVAIVSLSETDSAGRYRLENIPPGRYFVTAGLTDLPTFYPGAMAAATATVVTVAPGSTTNGIDFSMQRGTGVKVTGRLAILPTLKPSTPDRAILVSPPQPAINTTINEDGTFAFPLVRPGTYTLRSLNGLVKPTTLVVNDLDINLVVGADEKGVRVIGKAVVSSAPESPVAAQIISLSGSGQGLSAQINTDGTFEFLRVPPGAYTIRSIPSVSPPTTLVVSDKDITNLEVSVPFLAVVSARITVEDGAAPQILSIEARSPNGIASTVVAVSPGSLNDSFTLRLSEGSQQIAIRNLPLGYVIKSINSGSLDLTKSSLDVRPGKPIEEVRIVIGKTPIESIAGVKVSGKVVGLTGANLTTARVVLSPGNAGGIAIETRLNADGTFEFSNVRSGLYYVLLLGPPPLAVTPREAQIFVQAPVSNLHFIVSPMTQIQGVISAVDANGAAVAGLPANLSVQFRNANGISFTSTQPGTVFRVMLAEGEYTVSVDQLPAGFTVKSILYGSTDITRAPLKITGAQPTTDIQIILQSR